MLTIMGLVAYNLVTRAPAPAPRPVEPEPEPVDPEEEQRKALAILAARRAQRKKTKRLRYEALVRAKICTTCEKNSAREGKTTCEPCSTAAIEKRRSKNGRDLRLHGGEQPKGGGHGEATGGGPAASGGL